jgi:hypothetical protein
MGMSPRKRIGVALVVLSIVGALVFALAGFQLVRLIPSQPPGNMTVIRLELHWSLLVFGVMALIGLLCIVLPNRLRDRHREGSA